MGSIRFLQLAAGRHLQRVGHRQGRGRLADAAARPLVAPPRQLPDAALASRSRPSSRPGLDACRKALVLASRSSRRSGSGCADLRPTRSSSALACTPDRADVRARAVVRAPDGHSGLRGARTGAVPCAAGAFRAALRVDEPARKSASARPRKPPPSERLRCRATRKAARSRTNRRGAGGRRPTCDARTTTDDRSTPRAPSRSPGTEARSSADGRALRPAAGRRG